MKAEGASSTSYHGIIPTYSNVVQGDLTSSRERTVVDVDVVVKCHGVDIQSRQAQSSARMPDHKLCPSLPTDARCSKVCLYFHRRLSLLVKNCSIEKPLVQLSVRFSRHQRLVSIEVDFPYRAWAQDGTGRKTQCCCSYSPRMIDES